MLITLGRGLTASGSKNTPNTITTPPPTYDFDFANTTYTGGIIDHNNAYNNSAAIRNYAGYNARYLENKDGSHIFQKDNIVKRSDRGLWVLPFRGNNLLHSRDLTNTVWVKTNITAVKNQTGFLGDTNAASAITATANNATIMQSTTISASDRVSSAFVKRLSGSGTLEFTQDGGANWATLTITNDLKRIEIPTVNLTNPQVGFRIQNSGDSFAIDCVQLERGPLIGSPIPTTTDIVGIFQERPSAYVSGDNDFGELLQGAFGFCIECAAIRAESFSIMTSDSGPQLRITNTGGATFGGASTGTGQFTRDLNIVNKVAGYINADGTVGLCLNGNAVVNSTTSLSPSMTHCDFGTNGNASLMMHGYFPRMQFFAGDTLTDADLLTLTS
jgi:hypothetical protein